MLIPTIAQDVQLTRSDRGRWQIPVPREHALNLQRRLEKLGYHSTLCMCPDSQEACLELWPDFDAAQALEALRQPPEVARTSPLALAATAALN